MIRHMFGVAGRQQPLHRLSLPREERSSSVGELCGRIYLDIGRESDHVCSGRGVHNTWQISNLLYR